MKTLPCFWLGFGLPSDIDSMLLHELVQITMAHCSTTFLSYNATSIIQCRGWIINIFIGMWEVHYWLWDPTIQNTQINSAYLARCTLSVSYSTDLDYCFVFVDKAGVFPEHVHRTLKASECLTPNFPVISFYFACLLVLVACTTAAATFT